MLYNLVDHTTTEPHDECHVPEDCNNDMMSAMYMTWVIPVETTCKERNIYIFQTPVVIVSVLFVSPCIN
jgi:hypothetical protein